MRKDNVIEEDRDGPSSRMQHREQNEKERANEACGKTYFMTRERKSSSHQEIPTARKVYQVYCVPASMTKELTIAIVVVKRTRVASFYSNLQGYSWGGPTSPRRQIGIVLICVLLEDHSCPY